MPRVLPPDRALLVPFLAVVLQRLETLGSRAGIEVAERQNGSHCVDAIGEPELRDHDDFEALRPHLLFAGAAGAPFRHAAIMRQAVLPALELPATGETGRAKPACWVKLGHGSWLRRPRYLGCDGAGQRFITRSTSSCARRRSLASPCRAGDRN